MAGSGRLDAAWNKRNRTVFAQMQVLACFAGGPHYAPASGND